MLCGLNLIGVEKGYMGVPDGPGLELDETKLKALVAH